MEWEGVWASQYPSNDGKDGRVDLIRLDKDRTGKIIATKLTGAGSLGLPSSLLQLRVTAGPALLPQGIGLCLPGKCRSRRFYIRMG